MKTQFSISISIVAAWKGVFLGPSSDGKLYFNFPDDRKIRLYEFDPTKTRTAEKEMDGMVDSNSKMHCFVRDPYKELVILILAKYFLVFVFKSRYGPNNYQLCC